MAPLLTTQVDIAFPAEESSIAQRRFFALSWLIGGDGVEWP